MKRRVEENSSPGPYVEGEESAITFVPVTGQHGRDGHLRKNREWAVCVRMDRPLLTGNRGPGSQQIAHQGPSLEPNRDGFFRVPDDRDHGPGQAHHHHQQQHGKDRPPDVRVKHQAIINRGLCCLFSYLILRQFTSGKRSLTVSTDSW